MFMELLGWGGLLCGLLPTGQSCACDQEGTGEFRALSLRLETPSNHLLVSGVLTMIVCVGNDSSSDVEAAVDISSASRSSLRFYVTGPDRGKTFSRYEHIAATSCGFARKHRFKPGERISSQIAISESQESGPEGVFGIAGSYRIKAELWYRGQRIESPEVAITVDEPTGKDLVAAQFLREKGLVKSLGVEAKTYGGKWAIAEMKEFLSKYGDTAYAWQVRLALATILRNGLPTSWQGDSPEVKERLSEMWAALDGSFSRCPPEIFPEVLCLAIETKCFQRDRAGAMELLSLFQEKCSWHPRYADLEDLKKSVEKIKPGSDK